MELESMLCRNTSRSLPRTSSFPRDERSVSPAALRAALTCAATFIASNISGQLHAEVDRNRTFPVGQDSHRIQIQLGDLWKVLDQLAHSQQDIAQRAAIGLRRSAISVEKLRAPHL